tara:strand:- start:384 stop:554 length:171 start_codon:yes stop_codon:yes gene_type:complete
MNQRLQKFLFVLTVSIILWSIIINIISGGDWGWQVVALSWAVIAIMNQLELNEKDE